MKAAKGRKTRSKARNWVIFLTDRRELGAPLRCVSKHGPHATHRAELARRFASEADARRWLKRVPAGDRLRRRYRATYGLMGVSTKQGRGDSGQGGGE